MRPFDHEKPIAVNPRSTPNLIAFRLQLAWAPPGSFFLDVGNIDPLSIFPTPSWALSCCFLSILALACRLQYRVCNQISDVRSKEEESDMTEKGLRDDTARTPQI